ncbi:MAG: adenylyl-sulfate kinase [bacterium]
MAQGFTLWLTGLPASGKSAIAARLEESLLERGLEAERLDEGEIRQSWLPSLGHGAGERDGLTRLIGHFCNLLTRNGIVTIAASISPSQEIRNEIRSQIGRFVEVHVRCPAEVCAQRDASGNWARARAGELSGFVGADVPYEEPTNPEILLEADREDTEQAAKKIVRTLEILDWIPKAAGGDYDAADEAKITKRLKDLGYI